MIEYHLPIEQLQSLFNDHDQYILFESSLPDVENRTSYLFLDPIAIIECNQLDKVTTSLAELNTFLSQGYYAAGYLAYEAGYAFEERLMAIAPPISFPLIRFGIYRFPILFDHRTGTFTGLNRFLRKTQNRHPQIRSQAYTIKHLRRNISPQFYFRTINQIKTYIEHGDTYQVNYTLKYKFEFDGSPLSCYQDLRKTQPVPYSALIRNQMQFILSFSPELFFRKQGSLITVKPMKGTLPRGRYLEEDLANISFLQQDIKNRSENVMITDLLRNDLGRISTYGSVHTKQLCKVEKYQTLFQMTSTVTSRLREPNDIPGLLRNIFPSGSVTGAPKLRTMELIRELEPAPRGIYTGSIGFISPEKDAVFNVAIRTVIIDQTKQSGELGVGSGIVYDSDPQSEFRECELKSRFLTISREEFQLIETFLWTPQHGYFLLDLHLDRLASSAQYFTFRYSRSKIIAQLRKREMQLLRKPYHVRLLLHKTGKVQLTSTPLDPEPAGILPVTFSRKTTNTADIFLYHKTTLRTVYDRELARVRAKGFYEVIFQNEKGEITEGAISNIWIKKNGKYYTPPRSSGILNGVYRQYFMYRNRKKVIEKILYKPELLEADEIFLTNSVRGKVKVDIKPK